MSLVHARTFLSIYFGLPSSRSIDVFIKHMSIALQHSHKLLAHSLDNRMPLFNGLNPDECARFDSWLSSFPLVVLIEIVQHYTGEIVSFDPRGCLGCAEKGLKTSVNCLHIACKSSKYSLVLPFSRQSVKNGLLGKVLLGNRTQPSRLLTGSSPQRPI